MVYRLLVDLEAVAVLDALPGKVRRKLLDHLAKLRGSPESFSHDHECDNVGRRIEISIVAGHAIHYWIDPPDRHIKVLKVRSYR